MPTIHEVARRAGVGATRRIQEHGAPVVVLDRRVPGKEGLKTADQWIEKQYAGRKAGKRVVQD